MDQTESYLVRAKSAELRNWSSIRCSCAILDQQPVEELGHRSVGFGDDTQEDFTSIFGSFSNRNTSMLANGSDFFERLAGVGAQAFA
jgi:hypothetical protein